MSIDWNKVRRVLVIRLRSIGDTVLSTSSLIALRRALPDAEIDILLEDWVAPLLDGFDGVNVIAVGKSSTARLRAAWQLRKRRYDVGFNLHGGTTATTLLRLSGAKRRVGLSTYQYPFLYTDILSSPSDFWGKEKTHSAEQQLSLLGHVGIPVNDRPRSVLYVTDSAIRGLKIRNLTFDIHNSSFALIHPAAAFDTKRWPVENFARTAEYFATLGIHTIAVATSSERELLDELSSRSAAPITKFDDLTLPEITALASRAAIFVGNDSGIAHIAAAVNTPTVVIFGSSNRAHWHPWTNAPHEVVFRPFDCQPCPGYTCEVYGEPRCILSVSVEDVTAAIDRVRPRMT